MVDASIFGQNRVDITFACIEMPYFVIEKVVTFIVVGTGLKMYVWVFWIAVYSVQFSNLMKSQYCYTIKCLDTLEENAPLQLP